MKNKCLMLICLLTLCMPSAFCDSIKYVNKSVVFIDKNVSPYEIENTEFLYKYVFIDSNKIESYVRYDNEEYFIKENTLELNKINDNCVLMNHFGSDNQLLKEYYISFIDGNRVRVNEDVFVLREDSYYLLKNDVLNDASIKDLLGFLKTTIFLYHREFDDFESHGFIQEGSYKRKYFILSATLHFSTGQSEWIYDYEAVYSYSEGLLRTMEISSEEEGLYFKLTLEAKNKNFLVYHIYRRIAEGCYKTSNLFIDLTDKMFQESGEYVRSCYEYLYQCSWVVF
ncbi:MAG: hypothetical protein NC489_29460 [Ruminococcus flavefaciens]|nr:hypothetical protein [Ruminococcus flavefaciens]